METETYSMMERYAICQNGGYNARRNYLPWVIMDTERGWVVGRAANLIAAIMFVEGLSRVRIDWGAMGCSQ